MRGGREGKREGGRVRGVKEIKRVHVHMTEREGGKEGERRKGHTCWCV